MIYSDNEKCDHNITYDFKHYKYKGLWHINLVFKLKYKTRILNQPKHITVYFWVAGINSRKLPVAVSWFLWLVSCSYGNLEVNGINSRKIPWRWKMIFLTVFLH